jgi:hypothetical protein
LVSGVYRQAAEAPSAISSSRLNLKSRLKSISSVGLVDPHQMAGRFTTFGNNF